MAVGKVDDKFCAEICLGRASLKCRDDVIVNDVAMVKEMQGAFLAVILDNIRARWTANCRTPHDIGLAIK